MPKVGVIIPCNNHGQYIDADVALILKQTYQEDKQCLILPFR